MISISTNHTVSWPTPASPSVPAVSNVAAVQPVRETGRDAQTGLGAGRDGQTASPRVPAGAGRSDREVAVDGAPLLPRSYGPNGADARAEAGRAPGQPEAASPDAQDKAEEARQATAQQAEEKAAAAERQQLQAVLTNVWQASAAVVERALGRLTGGEGELSGVSGESAADPAGVEGSAAARRPLLPAAVTQPPVEPLPWPVMPEADAPAAAVGAPAELRPVEDVVAYDENGNSSWAPLEVGGLISQRV